MLLPRADKQSSPEQSLCPGVALSQRARSVRGMVGGGWATWRPSACARAACREVKRDTCETLVGERARLEQGPRLQQRDATLQLRARETIRQMTNSHKSQSEKQETNRGRENAAKTPRNGKIPCLHYTRDASTWAAETGFRAPAPHRARARDRASSEEV